MLALAVGVALIARRQRGDGRSGDGYLGLFLVAGALSLLGTLVQALALYRLHPHFYITPLFYTFALGPLLYGAVRARLDPAWRLGPRDGWHAVLPVVQAVQSLSMGLAPLAVKDWFWQSTYGAVEDVFEVWIFPFHFAAYLVAAWGVARRAEASPEATWLRRFVGGCLVIAGVVFVTTVAYEAGVGGARDWVELGASLAYAALLYWGTLSGWRYALLPRMAPAPRRETYGMTDADLAAQADRVRTHVEAERPYLDPDLTLAGLAAQVGLDERALSYVLNAGLGTAYADYVNGLRVAEAQRQLRDAGRADATVLEIAMASGFASKATFNRAFKRATGLTPTAFRQAEAPRLTTS